MSLDPSEDRALIKATAGFKNAKFLSDGARFVYVKSLTFIIKTKELFCLFMSQPC